MEHLPARHNYFNRKGAAPQQLEPETLSLRYPKKPTGEKIWRLLNLQEAERDFGLSRWQVYRGVERDRIHAVQRDGRLYYLPWELEKLAIELGVNTALPQGEAS